MRVSTGALKSVYDICLAVAAAALERGGPQGGGYHVYAHQQHDTYRVHSTKVQAPFGRICAARVICPIGFRVREAIQPSIAQAARCIVALVSRVVQLRIH